MNKKYVIGCGALIISLASFYGAVNSLSCGSDDYCRENPNFLGGKVVKAIDVTFKTDTSDNWSGKDNPSLTVSSPKAQITLPPPPPPRTGH